MLAPRVGPTRLNLHSTVVQTLHTSLGTDENVVAVIIRTVVALQVRCLNATLHFHENHAVIFHVNLLPERALASAAVRLCFRARVDFRTGITGEIVGLVSSEVVEAAERHHSLRILPGDPVDHIDVV